MISHTPSDSRCRGSLGMGDRRRLGPTAFVSPDFKLLRHSRSGLHSPKQTQRELEAVDAIA